MTKAARSMVVIVVMLGLGLGAMASGIVVDRLWLGGLIEQYLPSNFVRQLPGANNTVTRVVNEESVVIEVVEKAAPAVVTVSIIKERPVFQYDPFGMFGFPRRQFSGETETIEQDIGTGFVIEGGLVITNRHVVDDASADYEVIDENGSKYQVNQIYRDPGNDLAILSIDNANLPFLELGDSNQLKVGQTAIAIGTPLGEFRHTVTKGVVSGLGRGIRASSGWGGVVEELDNVIQTDAAINPGNSGGPLLNIEGQVIGINTAVSAGAENIGFAIPINVLKESLSNFEQTGRFDRAFLGVSYQQITREAALLNEVPEGAYVEQVVPGSAAEDAGLVRGDIITALDGEKLSQDTSLAEIIGRKRVGDRLSIEYFRDGETNTIETTLKSSSQ